MTIFGKVLIGLMLVTAGVLIIKGGVEKSSEDLVVEEAQDQDVVATTDVSSEGKFNGSVKDLMARGGDHECSFTETNDMSDSTGQVYISGSKIRGDFNTTVKAVSDMKVESHMISDGEFVYTWSSMLPTGMKMPVVESSSATTSTDSQTFDYNQKLDYDCRPWTVDASKFVVPTEIKFTEIKS